MLQILENLPKIRIKLELPLVTALLSKHYGVTDIARITNQSHQWVSEYIQKNYKKFLPLLDNQDVIAAMQAKYISQRARNELENVLDACKDFTKKDLIPLTAVSDRHTQQYRLLSDKSTQNVSIDTVHTNLKDIQARKAELQKRLDKMTGSSNVGNQEVIDADGGGEDIK